MEHQGQSNPPSLFHGLGYAAMWAGSPFDSPDMGQLPPLPATWKWVALNWGPFGVGNMYCVQSIILFNLASPTTIPTFCEWYYCQIRMFLIQLHLTHYLEALSWQWTLPSIFNIFLFSPFNNTVYIFFSFCQRDWKPCESIQKTLQALQWHFQWEFGKDLCVNEDKESQWAVQALQLSVC